MREDITRRMFILLTGAAFTTSLAGCTGAEDTEDEEYEEGVSEAEAQESQDQEEGQDQKQAQEQEQEENQETEEEDEPNPDEVENRKEGMDVLEFGDLAIMEYEEEIEEREYGDDQLIISGVVENRDDEKYDRVFVGVRAYNEDGHQLDRYLDSTSDLQGGGTWAFEVKIYNEPAEDISEWDIGVWGSQY